MLKILSRTPNRDFYIFIKSTPEQYSNSKIKIKGIREEIKALRAYEIPIKSFDDFSGTSIIEYIDQFSKRGQHSNLDIFDLPQP